MEKSLIINSVIQEMERAFDLARRLQSHIKLGSHSEPLKETASCLSDEVLQTCSTTLSALKSCHRISTKKRKLRGAAAVRGPDLRSRSFAREEVTAAPYDDGHQWRKYGEKVIKGCFSTRSYYRCTFSDDKRCQARKQVQRDAKDPALFLVIYRGDHTCNSITATHGSSFQTATSGLTSSSGSLPPQDHFPFQLLCFDSERCPETTTTESENKLMTISSHMNTAMIIDENLSRTTSSCKLEPAATFIDQSEEDLLGGASSSDTSVTIDEDDAVLCREIRFPSSDEEIDLLEFDFYGILEDFSASISK